MDSYPQDFPYGILDVAELLHLQRRRPGPNSVYTDCPFCKDRRGKMNLNYVKNVWRCNYCGEQGGMLSLYARLNHITNSEANREIREALRIENTAYSSRPVIKVTEGSGDTGPGLSEPVAAPRNGLGHNSGSLAEVPQSPRADIQEIHQTLSLLFGMLTLRTPHRLHLRSDKRGLTDEQIEVLGFKSTPLPFLCRSLTDRLIKQGCTVQGVPGFYMDEDGRWTVKFHRRTSGILIPAVGIDGLIRGAQILLDTPIKNKDDPPDKAGTKYIWLSSSNRNMGVTSGSPVHFIGNPCSRTIYITEGLLKADIAHMLMDRSFVAVAGANNTQQLDPLFGVLAQNGTELIIEAADMDKFNNHMTSRGASRIYLMAKSHGMDCRPLTWNPNYKGIDDWQLALRKKERQAKKKPILCFKESFLWGQCSFESINGCIEVWQTEHKKGISLMEYLGLSSTEYEAYIQSGAGELKTLLKSQQSCRRFRIYQLDFDGERRTIPFAFKGIDALHKADYTQPPAMEYRLMCEDKLVCPWDSSETEILDRIFSRYSGALPEGYHGRSLAPSDVVELYDREKRSYYYRDKEDFVPVGFSPFFAKPMKEIEQSLPKGIDGT